MLENFVLPAIDRLFHGNKNNESQQFFNPKDFVQRVANLDTEHQQLEQNAYDFYIEMASDEHGNRAKLLESLANTSSATTAEFLIGILRFTGGTGRDEWIPRVICDLTSLYPVSERAERAKALTVHLLGYLNDRPPWLTTRAHTAIISVLDPHIDGIVASLGKGETFELPITR